MRGTNVHRPIGDLVADVESWNPVRDGRDRQILYIDLSSVNQYAKQIKAASTIVAKQAPSRARQLVRTGDVLVSTVRPNLNGVARVPTGLDGATASTGFCVLRPDQAVLDGAYLFHWVKTPVFIGEMIRRATGASYPAVSDRIVFESRIPLPPLPEQRRIAAILDQSELLRARRCCAIARLNEFAHSLFLEQFGDPARNTQRLPIVTLGEIGRWRSGGTPPRAREDYFRGGVPWFSSGELEEMFVAVSKEQISEKALTETAAKVVPRGSLLLGMYDTAALKASIAAVECSCNQAVAFTLIDQQVAETVFVYFAIVIGRDHFRRLQRGVRQKNLNLEMVRQIPIPLPPLSQQHAFAAQVAAVERLESSHRASLAKLDALFASLQHRAFRGEL